jgi:hypothetical protein
MSNPLTAEARRLEYLADCQHAVDELFQQAMRAGQPRERAFMEFIEAGRRFSHLSAYNAMLVRVQRPGAVAVGTRTQWRSIGRTVKRGAPPLVILWPFGPVAFLFEYSDTEGEPLPGESANCLFAEGKVAPKAYDDLVNAARRHDVYVEHDNRHGLLSAGMASVVARGTVSNGKTARPAWRVVVNANLDEPSRFATLAHELGHIYCGHLGGGHDGAWSDRGRLGENEREVEAEAVSFLVCARNGITTRSDQYLRGYLTAADMTKVSIYSIYEAANRVESRTPRGHKPSGADRLEFPKPASAGGDQPNATQ